MSDTIPATSTDTEAYLRISGIGLSSSRDWTEDAAHENGRYQCRCVICKLPFVGHKRRVICRTCHVAHAKAVIPSTTSDTSGNLHVPPATAQL